jgi:hypothetical protein
LLAAIDTEVNQVSQTTDLPYTDSQYLSFISDVNFAKGIKSVDKQLTEQEKLAKEQAEQKARKEWAKQHPVEALLQNVNDETTKLFKWANQEVQDFNLNVPGVNYVKDQISLRLGFISKACETIGDLALGATQLGHLTVESIQWGANTLSGQKTPQWIKDDVTSAGMTILTTDIFIKQLQHGDVDAWKAVYKGIENSANQVFHNITSGNTFEIGGYLFDVATLVGPAAVGKLKYVDEASNLAKFTKTEEIASTVGKVEDRVKVSKVDELFDKLKGITPIDSKFATNVKSKINLLPKKSVSNLKSDPITEFQKELASLPHINLSPKVSDGIISLPQGKRPSVNLIYSQEEIDSHLGMFKDGVVKVMSYEDFYNCLTNYNGSIGHPEGQFVMPKFIYNKAVTISDGNPRILEQLLALDEGYLGEKPIKIEASTPKGLRMPSGNEKGAYQGLWEPGGDTQGDIPEAVIDQLKKGDYTYGSVYN